MASYHLSVKSGAKGRGAAHASYIAREDRYADYHGGEDLECTASGNLPSWAADSPRRFWQMADTYERANGSAYREYELALPRELTPPQRRELVEQFIHTELGARHTWQYAIHSPKAAIDGEAQPHAHIMFCERINDGHERQADQYFRRANRQQPALGGAAKARFGETPTERKAWLVGLRERWCSLQNECLARYGHSVRVDHRTLTAQGTDRVPERHLGPAQVRTLSAEQRTEIRSWRNAERALVQAEAEKLPVAEHPEKARVMPPLPEITRSVDTSVEQEQKPVQRTAPVPRETPPESTRTPVRQTTTEPQPVPVIRALTEARYARHRLQEKEKRLCSSLSSLSTRLDTLTAEYHALKERLDQTSALRFLKSMDLQKQMNATGTEMNGQIPEENRLKTELKAVRSALAESETEISRLEAKAAIPMPDEVRELISDLLATHEELYRQAGFPPVHSRIRQQLFEPDMTVELAQEKLDQLLERSYQMFGQQSQSREQDNEMDME